LAVLKHSRPGSSYALASKGRQSCEEPLGNPTLEDERGYVALGRNSMSWVPLYVRKSTDHYRTASLA
jgi:hypothetical protein